MKLRNEIKDTWAEIKEHEADGSFLQRYGIGDYKVIDLGENGIIRFAIRAFGVDSRPDGTKALISWVAADLTKKRYRMHHDWFGQWGECDLRATLSGEVLDSFSEDVRAAIVPVIKKQIAYKPDWTCFTERTLDDLWIPSFSEMFEGVYSGFDTEEERALDQFYWCRSANGNNSFNGVNSSGSYDYYYANGAYPLALGFST